MVPGMYSKSLLLQLAVVAGIVLTADVVISVYSLTVCGHVNVTMKTRGTNSTLTAGHARVNGFTMIHQKGQKQNRWYESLA